MSESVKFSKSLGLLPLQLQSKNPTASISFHLSISSLSNPSFKKLSLPTKILAFRFPGKINVFGEKVRVFNASLHEVVDEDDDDSPVSVELANICSESQFDRFVAEAQQLEESLVIIWMASWCRKCIYLKPKLEKLAADYHPRLRFYRVDVNNVSHKLVTRAGVTKMPTIQLWKDGKKQAEVIGGHKGYLVVNEVREMIENEDST